MSKQTSASSRGSKSPGRSPGDVPNEMVAIPEEEEGENEEEAGDEHFKKDEDSWGGTCQELLSVTCQKWIKIRSYIGNPQRHDFKLIEERLRCIGDGEILIQGLCWTVDNFMKVFDIDLGSVMQGEQVASVINSCHKDFPPCSLVVCAAGWTTHAIVNPDLTPVRKVKDIGELNMSLCLGTLGLPGLTAYFGFFYLCGPVEKDVVVVNAGAGSVGNVVGQLAKIRGCTVVAFASSKERCEWLRELGFDYVFNYKTVSVSAALHKVAPTGVDCYFDSVGAEFTSGVLSHMKPSGRICMCGQSVAYCKETLKGCDQNPYKLVLMKDRRVSSHSVWEFQDQFDLAEAHLLDWVQQGKLRFQETMIQGFHQLPTALTSLYDGVNVGKVIVRSSHATSLQVVTVQY